MSEELREQLRKIAAEKQMIELKLQELELKEVNQSLSVESSTDKRKSSRIIARGNNKNIKLFARDNLKIKGLSGTLGLNLNQLGSNIEAIDKESNYFLYLSKNSIIDITNTKKGSQIDLLGGSPVERALIKYKHENLLEPYPLNEPFKFEKVKGIISLKNKYREIDSYVSVNEDEAVLKKICTHILYPIAYNSSTLHDNYLNKCSEQTLLIRFWGNLFEYYFNRPHSKLFLQWGDTVSVSCKSMSLYFKLDIRIMYEKDDNDIDVLSGEVASVPSTTKPEYYNDALKLCLSSKQHLNHLLSSARNISPNEISKIKLPIIHIMGMNCRISILNLIDKNVYVVQDIFNFKYPKTIKQVNEGGIQKLMTGLSLLENLLLDIDDIYNDVTDKMDIIKNELINKKSKSIVNDYISAVIWDKLDDKWNNDIESKSEEEE
ncbi:hypothetical protein BD770DRAFT_396772 [Pilaira anomala]|nr:hypothetical protein BD770DRAFT_396772 [Pilaira anomala]